MRLRSRHQQRRAIARGVLCAMVILALGCARRSQEEHAHDASHPDPSGDETVQRGPEGGRLFTGHGIQLELEIVEEGIPPEFRAYLYDDHGRRLPPQDARIAVVLDRLGGRRDSLPFRAETDFSRSQRSVEEPHSFAARVLLEWRGQRQEWSYEQVEGRVALHPEAVTTGDIRIGTAGPRLIEVRVEAPGEVRLNAERVVQVRPRFPGIVQNLRGELGDDVRPGDLLAAVHSNESLTEYSVFAPIRGTIVSREVAVGQSVDHETVLYTVADLSTVWVDFALYPPLASQVRRGQRVHIRTGSADGPLASGTIRYVGPLLEQDTRVSYGRVVLDNADGRWTPGLYVTASVTVDRAQAPVAVPNEAIIRTSRGPAVFRAHDSTFELQPVVAGRSDGEWTEILDGLAPGAQVVVHNAFLLKAELGKSEATHEH